MKKSPPDKCYRIVAARGNEPPTLYLYSAIGEDLFSEGVTAKAIASELKALGKVKKLDVRVNSEGGSVFEGKAIYSLLQEFPAHITAYVDGLAASIASLIIMAADEIVIAEGAYIMVHRPSGMSFGTADEHRKLADVLDSINVTLIDAYVARSGLDREKVEQLVEAETWMTGVEAKSLGFADRVVPNMKVAACVRDPSKFRNLPAALRPNRAAALSLLSRRSQK